MTGVATAAKSTTEGAKYTNKAAGELARLATTLQSLVREFDYEIQERTGPGNESRAGAAPVEPNVDYAQGDLFTHVRKAISAHGEWKNKFQDFMTGKIDLDPPVCATKRPL